MILTNYNIKGYIYNISNWYLYSIFFFLSLFLFVVTINCCNYMKYPVNKCHTDMFSQCMLYKLIIPQNNIFKMSHNNNNNNNN